MVKVKTLYFKIKMFISIKIYLIILRSRYKDFAMHKKAFTLSEVMLVLSVIGVIAALTIPGIKGAIDSKLRTVRSQKVMSTFSGTVSYIMASRDSAGDLMGTGIFNRASEDEINVVKAVASYLNGAKFCGNLDQSNCFPQSIYKNTSGTQCLNTRGGSFTSLMMPNGVPVTIDDAAHENTENMMYIFVDINGSSPPNRCGDDLLYFTVLRNGKIISTDYMKAIGIQ